MSDDPARPLEILRTTAGDLPLEEVELAVDGRRWSILHTGAVISHADEAAFLRGEPGTKLPYGIVLWPAAIAQYTHDVLLSAPLGRLASSHGGCQPRRSMRWRICRTR